MQNMSMLTNAVAHQAYAAALEAVDRLRPRTTGSDEARDRGAVSLEQVLWFVAAGVSVAVIAGVLWSQIKDKADDPISTPAAP
jgi:type VI protein secretion system component VasF